MPVYTIVTGASKGIGRAMATECARRGRNLILVSLPGEELEETARALSEAHGVCAEFYETDLTADGSVDKFYGWCREREVRVDMLINNAGLGSQGKFEHSSPDYFRKLMQLNMNTVASMCWSGISFLKEHDRSYILNVGSIGAFTPVPYKTVYSATKHFVLAFSDALYYELKDSPVFVSCLCPGPTLTNDKQIKKIKEQGLKARLITKGADEVARSAIDGIMRGKRIIVPGFGNKLIMSLSRMLPIRLRLKLAAAAFSGSSFNYT